MGTENQSSGQKPLDSANKQPEDTQKRVEKEDEDRITPSDDADYDLFEDENFPV